MQGVSRALSALSEIDVLRCSLPRQEGTFAACLSITLTSSLSGAGLSEETRAGIRGQVCSCHE